MLKGVTQEKKDECSARGNLAANAFISYLEWKYGGSIIMADAHTDMNDHIDFFYTSKEGKKISIDFKAIKFITKLVDDMSPDDAYNILELTAVNGSAGWVYGKADYICFETLDEWLWVPRIKLVEFVDKFVNKDKLTVGTICLPLYHLERYQRLNRKDIITVVTKEELQQLSIKIDKKPK